MTREYSLLTRGDSKDFLTRIGFDQDQ